MAALPVRRSPSRRSPSAVASQRGRGREGEGGRGRPGWMPRGKKGRREGGSARAPCAATVSSAPLVGPSIHPAGGNVRGARGCHSRRRTRTRSATTAAACVGLVVHITLENRPIRPTKSHLILPTATAAVRASADRPATIASFLSFLPSFQTRRGHRRRRWRGHRIRLQTAGRNSLSPFNHRARSLARAWLHWDS